MSLQLNHHFSCHDHEMYGFMLCSGGTYDWTREWSSKNILFHMMVLKERKYDTFRIMVLKARL